MSAEIKKNKILLITNIPNPYRIPLFNELSRQLESKALELKVVFGAMGYSRRKWNIEMSECNFSYDVLFSPKITLVNPEKTIFTYKGLLKIIKKDNPNVIITIGFSFATMKLWWRSLLKETNYIIWSGAINSNYKQDSFLRKIQRKMLVRRAAGFIAYGIRAKEYLVSLGADPDEIEIGINTVDTKFFKNETEKFISTKRNGNKKNLLCISHFVRRKRIDLLLKAVRYLKNIRNDFILKVVGDGPELERMRTLAQQLNIIDHVSFEGFRQKIDIPQYLAEADCFLFPTDYDVWGLVLVEAMAAGLPCISSIYSGATYDLIEDGVNGFALDFSETMKIAEKINRILEDPKFARYIGQRASCFIEENVSIEKSASGFFQAIKRVLNQKLCL